MPKQDHKQAKVIVGAFVFNDNDELLLLKNKKFGGKYVCPGGHLEYNESLEDALKREVKEETGMSIEEIELVSVREGIKLGKAYKSKENHHVYLNYKAKLKSSNKKIKLNDEATGYKWQSLDAWKQEKNLAINIPEMIEELSSDSYASMYKRALADYQNLLKQSAKEKQDFAKYANENLLQTLLPVYDNLKTSLEHTDEKLEDSPWVEGVKYVVKQFKDALSEAGVEEIETAGKDFDHNTMEALSGKGDKVKKEIRPGYKLNGKVVVPARVELNEDE